MNILLMTLTVCTTVCPTVWASERLLPAPEQQQQEVIIPIASRFSSLSDFVTQYHEGRVQVSASSLDRDMGPEESRRLMDALGALDSKALQMPDDAVLPSGQLEYIAGRNTLIRYKAMKSNPAILAVLGGWVGFMVPLVINDLIKKHG